MGNCPSADGKPGAARTSSAVDQEQRDLDRALRVSALESRVDRGKDKRVRRKFERNMEMVHGAGAELGADAQAMKNTQNSAIGAARNIARNVAGTQQRQVEDSAAAAESRNAHLATAAESRLKKSVASDVSKKKRDKNWKIVFGQEDEEEEKATAEMANYSPAEMGSAENEAFEQAILSSLEELRQNPEEVVNSTLKMLRSIAKNILKYGRAEEEKYNKLRLSNEHVQMNIINVPGALDLLFSIGFVVTEFPDKDGNLHDFLYYDISELENAMSVLQRAVDVLSASLT